MARSPIAFKLADTSLTVGVIPRVVGTFSTLPRFLTSPDSAAADIPSDVVEMRLDHIDANTDWLERCQAIEGAGIPVLLTIRSKSEGGNWAGSEAERLALFRRALPVLSAVDIELSSSIAPEISRMAMKAGKLSVISYHDFERTPSRAALQKVIAQAKDLGSIVKISTMVKDPTDVETLQGLLAEPLEKPLCIIGMGPLGTETRVAFSLVGSCLTYGYLDKPSAPGQMSAARLVERLRNLNPDYNQDYLARKQLSIIRFDRLQRGVRPAGD